MKTISKYTLVLTMLAFCSCNYLDYDETSGFSKDEMFVYFSRTKKMLTNVYGYLPKDFGNVGNAMLSAATDDADYAWTTSAIHQFGDGSWSAINTLDDQWAQLYKGIRAANLFLESYQPDFPNSEWNDKYEDEMSAYVYYPYEARFLRAFFHFELAKRYNNVPLLTRTYSPSEVNTVEPSGFDQIVSFIVSECDEIAPELPLNYQNVYGSETGRITRGAVLALKSRVLLYAASKLHNPDNDLEKWHAAASAAKEVIDLNVYRLVPDESPVNNLSSQELILERREANSNTFESLNFPIGYEGGNSGNTPTQNLVDAFDIDGKPFDWNNSDHVNNIYNTNRRDPRLFATVLYNGAMWKGVPVECFEGGRNGLPLEGASRTSYYLRKYVQEEVNFADGQTTTAPHNWVLFRYAEVLLNYAEALYEYSGDQTFTSDEFPLSPLAAVNQIRPRAGVPALNVTNDFTDRLRNERRVELAFEDHRFWDIRRWMIGPSTREIYGVNVIYDGSNVRYERKLVTTRVWEDKMYFYPIPNTELFKNHKLVQNPGW